MVGSPLFMSHPCVPNVRYTRIVDPATNPTGHEARHWCSGSRAKHPVTATMQPSQTRVTDGMFAPLDDLRMALRLLRDR